MSLNYVRLSQTISHALRHAPEQYGLELDPEGWTPIETLLAALRKRRREWRNLSEDDLVKMLECSSKQRYELRDGQIRAYYGHSLPDKIQHTATEPPSILYHGTSPHSAEVILDEGLKSMKRQFVHLSTDEHTARVVGSRHWSEPVILCVQALEAHQAGVAFYRGNEDVWLADDIPPEFIDVV